MKKLFSLFITSLLMLSTTVLYAQVVVQGIVVDSNNEQPLIGANVVVKGTTIGSSTGLDGSFQFSVSKAELNSSPILEITYLGYIDLEIPITNDLIESEKIDVEALLESSDIALSEIEVTSSYGIDRKTPTTISNVSTEYINDYAGTQELPELMKMTPGVYATKEGGGVGDGRVYIRGFAQENIAVLINGIPVNDMENGRVYWSNWSGLGDVTAAMQVQRGLGASKLAINSIGGTINIITKSTDAKRGGSYLQQYSNYGQFKETFAYNTGRLNRDWAVSVLYSRTDGDGYVDGTYVHANTYFLSVAKEFSSKHSMVFTAVGSPQKHGQRDQYLTPEDNWRYGVKHNKDWGYYTKDGERQVWNMRNNYYHKPHIALNDYLTLSDKTTLNTSIYASYGKGGGSGPLGSYDGIYFEGANKRDIDGLIPWDKIAAGNAGISSKTILRNSVNNHSWYGILANLNHNIDQNWALSFGLDARTYKGEHFREVRDLMGGNDWQEAFKYAVDGDGGRSKTRTVDPNSTALWFVKTPAANRIAYDNDGKNTYAGLFGQVEYNDDKISAFLSSTVSSTTYKRIDRYNYIGVSNGGTAIESEGVNIIGYTAKGGINYNMSPKSNVYLNLGTFSRPPFFNFVFTNYQNVVVDPLKNEKANSMEIGYAFISRNVKLKANYYVTEWIDKSLLSGRIPAPGGGQTRAAVSGQNALHKGLELEFQAKVGRDLSLGAMVTIGDYKWKNNVKAELRSDLDQSITTVDVYADGLYVGNHPMNQFGALMKWQISNVFDFGAQWLFNDKLYADYDVFDRDDPSAAGEQVYRMNSNGITDARLGASFKLFGLESYLQVQVYNLFDNFHWARGTDTSAENGWTVGGVNYGTDGVGDNPFTRDGRALKEGFPGWGRTANISYKLWF